MKRLTVRIAVLILLAGIIAKTHAEIIPEADRNNLIMDILENRFWGVKGYLPDARYVQPASEEERKTVPVSKSVANRAIDAGEISGLAEWCNLDTFPHLISLKRAAQRKGLTEKQVVFTSLLHRGAQNLVKTEKDKSGKCGNSQRAEVARMLKQSMKRGYKGI